MSTIRVTQQKASHDDACIEADSQLMSELLLAVERLCADTPIMRIMGPASSTTPMLTCVLCPGESRSRIWRNMLLPYTEPDPWQRDPEDMAPHMLDESDLRKSLQRLTHEPTMTRKICSILFFPLKVFSIISPYTTLAQLYANSGESGAYLVMNESGRDEVARAIRKSLTVGEGRANVSPTDGEGYDLIFIVPASRRHGGEFV